MCHVGREVPGQRQRTTDTNLDCAFVDSCSSILFSDHRRHDSDADDGNRGTKKGGKVAEAPPPKPLPRRGKTGSEAGSREANSKGATKNATPVAAPRRKGRSGH